MTSQEAKPERPLSRTKKLCGCQYEGEMLVKSCPDADVPAFVGRKPCGCVVAASVDDGQHQADTYAEIARWAKNGLTVEVKTVGFVRHGGLASCPHGKSKPLALKGAGKLREEK